jgi:subtilase family serine protease
MRSGPKHQLGLRVTKLAGAALGLLSVLPLARGEGMVALSANHPDAVSEIASQGTAPGYQPLKMEIYLATHNQAQLDELSEEQQDKTSPLYHHWLTPAEFNQRFGPTDADVAQITQWLRAEGFSVTFASKEQRRIAFTGEVATAQNAFLVHIAQSSDGKHFGNVEDPQVPESIAEDRPSRRSG